MEAVLVQPGDDVCGEGLAAVKFHEAELDDEVATGLQDFLRAFEGFQFVALHIEFEEGRGMRGAMQDFIQREKGDGELLGLFELVSGAGRISQGQDAGGIGAVGAVNIHGAAVGANCRFDDRAGAKERFFLADFAEVFGQRFDADKWCVRDEGFSEHGPGAVAGSNVPDSMARGEVLGGDFDQLAGAPVVGREAGRGRGGKCASALFLDVLQEQVADVGIGVAQKHTNGLTRLDHVLQKEFSSTEFAKE